MKVLITGGAGYLGSIIGTALEQHGHRPVVLDSLRRGPRAFVSGRAFYEGDIGDEQCLGRLLDDHPDIGCTIHCAGLTSVPESVAQPAEYWRENVAESLTLFTTLAARGMPRVLFSSTAAVYASTDAFEVREDDPLDPQSPYARTKRAVEMSLEDMARAAAVRSVVLRYFNPIGSDPSYRSGVYDRVPSHVLGQLVAAATGAIASFTITGVDLPTRDGTGLRDYVHAWDLARAHVCAVERFDQIVDEAEPFAVMNIGTGEGTTVRELVAAFARVSGLRVPVREAPPRPGDVVGAYANVERAADVMGWRTQLPRRRVGVSLGVGPTARSGARFLLKRRVAAGGRRAPAQPTQDQRPHTLIASQR